MKGTTQSGFTFDIPDNLADDYELLEKFNEASKNEMMYTELVEYALGTEQKNALKEHCRINGRVSTQMMSDEFIEIVRSSKDLKK